MHYSRFSNGVLFGLIGITVALTSAPALAASQKPGESPFNGTWKIDQSSYRNTQEIKVVLKDGVYRCGPCGGSQKPSRIKADGKLHPVKGQPGVDMSAVKVLNDHQVAFTDQRDGKEVMHATLSVAPDGKTATWAFQSNDHGHHDKGRSIMVRVENGPTGSQAASGTWRLQQIDRSGTSSWTQTISIKDDGLDYSDSMGRTFHAKLDGTKTALHGGDPDEVISVIMLGPDKMQETAWTFGKGSEVLVSTVAPDGKTRKTADHNSAGFTESWTAIKQ